MKHLLVFSLGLSLLIPQLAQARPYACSNGRMQQHPCHYSYQELSSGALRHPGSSCEERGGCFGAYSDAPRARMADPLPGLVEDKERGRVLEVNLVAVQDGRGRWNGAIAGHGRVYLYLDYFRGSDLIETRSMGSTDIQKNEGSVNFSFESALPSGDVLGGERFDWKLRALVDRK